ncbi:MAG: M20/M25/M40 family metallo-hydrolase, partial [Flavisolibacter sp.]|nr:M20/M25/M40 family metallo-hydrolase [Flavisolibacter sp.]
AATWAKNTLAGWGLVNATLEPWGKFGKGWQQEHCYVAMTKPYYHPLIAIPRAWTGSTPGNKVLTGKIVLVKAKDSTELMAYKGKLANKIVMTFLADTLKPSFVSDASRFHDTDLIKMAEAAPRENAGQPRPPANPEAMQTMMRRFAYQRMLGNFLQQEKPALFLSSSIRNRDGTVFVQGGGSFTKGAPEAPASVVLAGEDYLRLQRLLEAGIPVEIEADVRTRFFSDDTKGYNVLAEIPGTDLQLKDEVVMLGGHLDSWHGATGATDNAAGCAVMMEAVRIIKSLNLQLRRTIRIALWSGEEQGLFGSRNYVKNHLGDPVTMQLKPEQAKISAYYNVDNGTGRIRGVYLQGNESVRPIFAQWLEPFRDLGASTLTINNTGGTDHLSFDAVGIPGFQFIQDPVEYDTRTHHSNMDTYEHLIPEDLMQAAVIVASFVYNTAQRDEKLPRKELPKPIGEVQRGF